MNSLENREASEGVVVLHLVVPARQTVRFPVFQSRYVKKPCNNPMFVYPYVFSTFQNGTRSVILAIVLVCHQHDIKNASPQTKKHAMRSDLFHISNHLMFILILRFDFDVSNACFDWFPNITTIFR